MPTKPINEVLADNLRYYMDLRELKSQPALAAASHVAQRTIGNYLRPQLRTEGSKGKPPSAKLAELEMIAGALKCEVWELLRPMSPAERIIYQKVEEAFAGVRSLIAEQGSKLVLHEAEPKRYLTGT